MKKKFNIAKYAALILTFLTISFSATASHLIKGQVLCDGKAVSNAEVTLYMADTGTPQILAEIKTGEDGRFNIDIDNKNIGAGVLYLIAKGSISVSGNKANSNPTAVMMATLGSSPPEYVTINELTTVASVWTGAQFLDGVEMSGNMLGLNIAAGNVLNLVDLQTGGLGPIIQDPLNSTQTSTMAKFNTLGILLSACIKDIPDASNKLFKITTLPGGETPTNTLTAFQNIARYPWHNADKLFALLDEFYPVPEGKRWREVSYIPFLSFAPSAWTLSLVYSGGGLSSLGGIAIDGEGNMWTDLNFLAGAQSTIFRQSGGGLGQLAPNGQPISPMTTGFRGGGIDGPGFGIAISDDDKVWVTSLIGKNISVFDRKTGKPLSPETGYDFRGKLGSMQGIIVAPNGDVWALDNSNNQIVYLPKGDASKGRILGQTVDGEPVDGNLELKSPFHLAIDHKDRIWLTNSGSNTVTRFPVSNPGNAEEFEVGYAPRAIAIDSRGNAWVSNTIGHPGTSEKLALIKEKFKMMINKKPESKEEKEEEEAKVWIALYNILIDHPGGDISMIQSDGTVLGPFNGNETVNGPWGIAVDGNDNIWVANSVGRSILQFCGVRPETNPQGFKTGDMISPEGGYVGGLQILTDIDIDPAGNVWVANNWDRPDEGFKEEPDEALSTRFAGNGTVVFFGLAKPVKTPLIGPVETH